MSFEHAILQLDGLPHVAALHSALKAPRLGRYSFLAADPFDTFKLSRPHPDPLAHVASMLERFSQFRPIEGLPPFQTGGLGFLAYEFGRCFEKVPQAKHNEFDLPIAFWGFYDVVLAWDNEEPEHGWIFSSGYPEMAAEARYSRARHRLDFFLDRLSSPVASSTTLPFGYQAMAHGLTAPQFQTRLAPQWVGNFDSLHFRAAVEKAREYIASGDIFQVNLAQRLLRPADRTSLELFAQLNSINPAPFASYLDGGSFQIVSASPERFLTVRDRTVETRPIKGTRRRSGDFEADKSIAQELLSSSKDRAENTMIVDLLRNDLSRVCEPNSIRVPQWCEIEEFPFLLHLVSAVEGKLNDSATISDLVRATFPGGSITGAPKIRAMEIVAELEPTVRGPYCGSMGYFGFDGAVDLNILIRTVTASHGWWQLQVGGGIVIDSQPEAEEEETWTKAAGLVAAIESRRSKFEPGLQSELVPLKGLGVAP